MSLLSHRPYSHLDNDDDIFRHRRIRKQQTKKLHKFLVATMAFLSLLLAVVVLAAIQVAVFGARGATEGGTADGSPPRRESSAAFEDALVVRTDCGEYIGTIEDGAFVFKGVPYAKAPVGHLRWKKPISWWSDGEWCGRKERRRAHKYARPCFHLDPDTGKPRGTEDCLFLNVWSPRLDTSAGLEVLVWLHGGFLQWGSGHEPGSCPSGRVAKRLNTVFVSFNYRLGAFGFLALDLLSQSSRDARGNYGLWDQVVALQWVRRNIRAFGGDPDKVTVFGADAGAASILALRASGAARGLFRSAWLLGPALTLNRSFEESSRRHRSFFAPRTGCLNETCLRRLSPRQVAEAFLEGDDPAARVRDQNDLPVRGIRPEQLIVIDGELLRRPPLETLEEGGVDKIPTLVGTTAQATDARPGPDDLFRWGWDQLEKYVVTSLDSFGVGTGKEALRHYNASRPDAGGGPLSAEAVYSSMVTDLRQTCPVHRMCERMLNSSAPLYRYVVTATPSASVKTLGYPSSFAFHPWDAVAFFDHLEHYLDPPRETDLKLRDQLHRLVRTFVRSGGGSPLPGWEPFPHQVALVQGRNVTLSSSYHSQECEFWKDKGFEDYAWVS